MPGIADMTLATYQLFQIKNKSSQKQPPSCESKITVCKFMGEIGISLGYNLYGGFSVHQNHQYQLPIGEDI